MIKAIINLVLFIAGYKPKEKLGAPDLTQEEHPENRIH